MTTPEPSGPDGRVGTLRGAGVQVDVRRAGRVVVAACMATLAILVIVFFVAGVHKNEQINRLQHHGVDITVTITGCQGLLGGSGSNAAGYDCRGSFTLGGQGYTEALPGTAFHQPGSTVAAVAVPGDPSLVAPVSIVDNEHASSSVFVLPAVLLVALVLLGGVVLLRRRQTSAAAPQ